MGNAIRDKKSVGDTPRPLAKVMGKEVDPEKVESPALKRILRDLADSQAGNTAWDKSWHKHDKCCTGFLFSQ